MPPKTRRTTARLAALCAATTAALGIAGTITAPHAADAATAHRVYTGTGWKIATDRHIQALPPKPYVLTFASTGARTRLTPYAKTVAAQLTALTGTKFTVTTTIETPPAVGHCPTEHHLILGWKYRPTGDKGISVAYPCSTNRPGKPDDRTPWGGTVWMDTEYWASKPWFSSNPTINDGYRKNAVAHEIGHLVGITHPNTDLDKDGKVEPYECPRTSANPRGPIMCAPNGGALGATTAGKYTSYDIAGLRQLVKNYRRSWAGSAPVRAAVPAR